MSEDEFSFVVSHHVKPAAGKNRSCFLCKYIIITRLAGNTTMRKWTNEMYKKIINFYYIEEHQCPQFTCTTVLASIFKAKKRKHTFRPCSHQDENFSSAFAKKWKLCSHQIFVFVVSVFVWSFQSNLWMKNAPKKCFYGAFLPFAFHAKLVLEASVWIHRAQLKWWEFIRCYSLCNPYVVNRALLTQVMLIAAQQQKMA